MGICGEESRSILLVEVTGTRDSSSVETDDVALLIEQGEDDGSPAPPIRRSPRFVSNVDGLPIELAVLAILLSEFVTLERFSVGVELLGELIVCCHVV